MDLLLIGKTGNGKSATANTILGDAVFKSKPSFESVTANIQSAVCEFKGRTIKVVDGPGIGDTSHIDLGKATEFVMKQMSDAVTLHPDGYHAFLLVVKFGSRFTDEDKECIRILKAIFGDSFVRDYCILLLTYGDEFYRTYKKKGKSFTKWCQNNDHTFQELYKECNKRVVLFNNITEDPVLKKKQMKKLIKIVDDLQSKGRRYSNEHFEFACRNREQLMVKVKEPKIRENALKRIDILMQRKKKIRLQDIDVQIIEMKQLKEEVQSLINEVKEADNQSSVLNDLLRYLNYLLEETEGNIEQIHQLVMERKIIVKRKEEAMKMVFDKDTVEHELKLKFEKILIKNGNYDEEIQKQEQNIKEKEKEMISEFSHRENNLNKQIKKQKGQLKQSWQQKDKEFDKSPVYQQKLQEIDKYKDDEIDKIRKEKMKACVKIEEEKKHLEEKKQAIRDEVITQLMGKFEDERQQEIMKILKEIDQLSNNFDKKLQEMYNSNDENDQRLFNDINEMKNKYIDEIKKVKSKSKIKCPVQ